MIKIKQIVNDVFLKAGHPTQDRLPRWVVLRLLYHKIDHYRNRLHLTDENRFLERWKLTVYPGVDEFQVNATFPGKWVVCHTMNDSDSNHIRREVALATMQNIDLYYLGPPSLGSASTAPHVAQTFTFFNESGQQKVKVTPKHDQNADYLFWYQPDRPLPPRLEQNYPLLENFVNAIACDTAIAGLAYMKARVNQDIQAFSVVAAVSPETLNAQVAALTAQIKSFDLIMNDLRMEMVPYLQVLEEYESQAMDEQTGPRIGWGGANLYGPGLSGGEGW